MGIKIIGTRKTQPEVGGYPDSCKLVDPQNGMTLFELPNFGTNPNPGKAGNGKIIAPWQECYAQACPGIYEYHVITTDKHPLGVLRLFYKGLEMIPTTNANVNHSGQKYAVQVNIEPGYSDTWRGSKCCQTVPPKQWEAFYSHFKIGDVGTYELIEEIKV